MVVAGRRLLSVLPTAATYAVGGSVRPAATLALETPVALIFFAASRFQRGRQTA